MPEVFHAFGYDLAFSPTGDIALASGTVEGQQRVLRRLLTNPGDYVWDMAYGAGLAQFLGQPIAAARIAAVSRSQMFMETAVSRTPAPVIDVQSSPDGTVTETIRYVDSQTGVAVPLTLPIGP